MFELYLSIIYLISNNIFHNYLKYKSIGIISYMVYLSTSPWKSYFPSIHTFPCLYVVGACNRVVWSLETDNTNWPPVSQLRSSTSSKWPLPVTTGRHCLPPLEENFYCYDWEIHVNKKCLMYSYQIQMILLTQVNIPNIYIHTL